MAGLSEVQLHFVDSTAKAMDFKRWLGERRDGSPLAVDTETTGLQPHGPRRDRIRLVQVGDAEQGWAIPWERWGGVFVEAMREYTGRVLFHNAAYDMGLLEYEEPQLIPWSRVDDTRTLAYLADPVRATGLKPLSARYVDPMAAAMQSQLDDLMSAQGWTWATIPVDTEIYWAYGALDTVLTCRIWQHLNQTVFADPGLRNAYELEVAVLPVLVGMMRRGARVDQEYASTKIDEFENRFRQLAEWCRVAHGVSPTSGPQMVKRFQEMGVVFTKMTKSGASYAFDKEVKDLLAIDENPHVAELARVGKKAAQLQRLVNTYLTKFVEDEYVHASINPIGAPKTSRMSINGPPLQTLPRASSENIEAIEARNCFIPRPGNLLVMCDWDQIELRLLGHFHQDPGMLEVLRDVTGADPFTQFARRIYSDLSISKKDPRRQLTKNAAYADAYGAGNEKFAITAGIPVSQATAFRQAYHSTYPMLRAFQLRVEAAGHQRLRDEGTAYVRTPFGHRLQVADDKIYALVNRLIQGTAANIMKQKLVEMDNAGIGEFLVLPVHDEVILDAPEDIAVEVGAVAAGVMEQTGLSVPTPVGVDGPYTRWGAKYE